MESRDVVRTVLEGNPPPHGGPWRKGGENEKQYKAAYPEMREKQAVPDEPVKDYKRKREPQGRRKGPKGRSSWKTYRRK